LLLGRPSATVARTWVRENRSASDAIDAPTNGPRLFSGDAPRRKPRRENRAGLALPPRMGSITRVGKVLPKPTKRSIVRSDDRPTRDKEVLFAPRLRASDDGILQETHLTTDRQLCDHRGLFHTKGST
jgi:hypothetical protein